MQSDRQRYCGQVLRLPAAIFVAATLVNYAWELAQSSLYVGGQDSAATWWHCLIAAFGDGLILLFIFTIGWFTFRTRDWFVRPGIAGYAVMCGAGILIAIPIEWVAVNVLGRWSYTPEMPLVLGIGVVPIMQMIVLPPLIFKLVGLWILRNE